MHVSGTDIQPEPVAAIIRGQDPPHGAAKVPNTARRQYNATSPEPDALSCLALSSAGMWTRISYRDVGKKTSMRFLIHGVKSQRFAGLHALSPEWLVT